MVGVLSDQLQNGAVNGLAVPQYQGCGQRIFQEIQLRSCPCGRISESCPWNPQSAAFLCHRRGRRKETGEDVALDDSWNYTDILWNGIQAEKVQRAFEKLNYREQTLLEKRLAICMTCGRVGSWKNRPTFEELAVMFEGSTASGAERAYRKAVDKLTELLVAEGAIHAVRLKQKSKIKRKKKIAAAIYEYQADCDGEWGEISFDFENGTAEIIRLADWDTVKTNKFASRAIAYLLNCENEKLPKEIMVAFE